MNKLLVGLLASALAILVAVFAVLYLRPSEPTAPVRQADKPPTTQQPAAPPPTAQNQPPAQPAAPPPTPQPAAAPAKPLPPGLLAMDTNADGAVDLAEFLSFRMRVFEALDANKDGLLTKEEFVKLAEPPYVPTDGAALPPLAERQRFLANDFDRIDTNKDARISKQEAQIQFTFDFQRADINGDGKLDGGDIAAPRRVSRQDFIDAEMKRFDTANASNDGKLTFAQFVASAKAQNPQPPQGLSAAQFDQLLAEQFAQMDANKDKIVTRAEYADFAAGRFKLLDRDGDGVLTDTDTTPPQSVTKKEFIDLELRRFEVADKNADGKLDAEEYYAAAKAEAPILPPGLTAEQFRANINQQFKLIDAGNKGAISRDDYAAFVAKRFDELDLNKDGTLTAEESRPGTKQDITKAEFIALEVPRLLAADTDKDGAVSLAEFQAGALKSGDRPANVTDDQVRKVAGDRFKEIDTNKDGKLSKDEVTAFVAGRFDQLDRNRDGKVTADEMGGGPEEINKADFIAAEVRNLLTADANNDGIVELSEFIGAALKTKERPTGMTDDQMRKVATDRFKEYDANKDNKLTKDEISAAAGKNFDQLDANKDGKLTRAERQPKPRNWITGDEFVTIEMRSFDQFDRNRDGKVALEEMLASIPKTLSASQQEEAKAGVTFRFNQLDTNRDGFVSREEFAASIRQLFARLDLNKDGRLTQEEINRAQAAQRQPPPPAGGVRPPGGAPGPTPVQRPNTPPRTGAAPPPVPGGQPPILIMPPPTPIR